MSAISDTGPLISSFQSDSLDVVVGVVGQIYITPTCVTELQKHGYSEALADAGSSIAVRSLTEAEGRQALLFAQQIASDSLLKDPEPRNHLGEAEAMALALRPEFSSEPLLIDERAGRVVAKQPGFQVTGFAGLLLSAVGTELLTAEQVKQRLDACRRQGTHYSEKFVEGIYQSAQKIEKER